MTVHATVFAWTKYVGAYKKVNLATERTQTLKLDDHCGTVQTGEAQAKPSCPQKREYTRLRPFGALPDFKEHVRPREPHF